jgi:hypothetical protein
MVISFKVTVRHELVDGSAERMLSEQDQTL